MYGASGGTSSASSNQQERVRKRMGQRRFCTIGKLDGQIKTEPANVTSGNNLVNTSASDLSQHQQTKRRKFGNDSRNVELMEVDGIDAEEKELDDIPIVVFNTPPSSRRSAKALNLRAFSNENSRFVKNVHKKKEVEPARRKTIGMEPNTSGLNFTLPTTSSANLPIPSTSALDSGPSTSKANHSFNKSDHQEPWTKRKFYVVENGGIPTEIYCTDFIHKVKQSSSNFGRYTSNKKKDDKNRTLLRVTDKWREDWSTNGVQMPLGNKKESYLFENHEVDLDLPPEELFELPKKLVARVATKYTKTYAKDYQPTPRRHYYKTVCPNAVVPIDTAMLHKLKEGMRKVRVDFEKARNLCWLVKQREKHKLTNFELFEEQVQKTAREFFHTTANSRDHPTPVLLPMSKRRMEKHLAEWKSAVELRSKSPIP